MAFLKKYMATSWLASTIWSASAGDFLSGEPKMTEVESSLENELHASGAMKERIDDFMQGLRPSFTALPKNQAGNLEHQTVRYILHRLFVQRHGWYIKGLEPNGDTFHEQGRADSYKDWVPSYLVGRLEKQVSHRGLDLHDLAVVGAAMEDLIRQEATNLVKGIYEEFASISDEPVSVQNATLVYAASFLSNAFWDAEMAVVSKDRFVSQYHDWNRTRDWLDSLEKEHLKGAADGGMEVTTKIAIDMNTGYGSFNDRQCTELKGALMNMWSKGKTTGRLRLADFYRVGLDSQWDLVEKKEYLGALGALDESNASMPLVLIANYLTARPNCLEATNLYAACCRNECEDLLGHLERNIAAPVAEPDRIIELVSALKSDTVAAPRELDAGLVNRLRQISDQHGGGKVKLHGRLFAQWMHHAYPVECPYPHEAGIADPSSPDQWIGEDIAASEEDRRQMVDESCSPEEAAADWSGEMQWSSTEELVAHHSEGQNSSSWPWTSIALFVILSSAVVSVLAMEKTTAQKVATAFKQVTQRQLCFAGFCCIAVATNMVNITLLAVLLCVGLALQYVLAMDLPGVQKTKLEKCLV